MAILKIMLFAGAKDAAGTDLLAIDVQIPMTIQTLKSAIAAHTPNLAPIVRFSRLAVGCEFVDDQYVIEQHSLEHDIALIPPVSGG